jgi:hypothetical protein
LHDDASHRGERQPRSRLDDTGIRGQQLSAVFAEALLPDGSKARERVRSEQLGESPLPHTDARQSRAKHSGERGRRIDRSDG